MKVAERVVIVALLSLLVGVAVYFYFAIKSVGTEENVALIPEVVSQNEPAVTDGDEENWREWYPTVVPITIGSTTLGASVADSLPERIQGLSGTPYLPEGLVKLFAFGSAGPHDIWMKDMNYSLDIIWVDREGNITHIEENISPDTYPQSFSSPTPAWYVIEANAGFVEENLITKDSKVLVSL